MLMFDALEHRSAIGNRLLARIPEATFRPIVATILGLLGAAMITNGARM
jgi:uncharacterized membrane protein YfcA